MIRFRDLLRSAGWDEFVLLLAVAMICGSALIFIGVSDLVRRGDFHDAEIRWMRSLRSPENPAQPIGPVWLSRWSGEVTTLGSGTVLTLLSLLVAGYLLSRQENGSAVLLLVSVGGATLLTNVLKALFGRDRPNAVPYLTVAVILARTIKGRPVKIYCVSAALVVSFLVGLSRVYLGVHYPTDVIAGWAVGIAWALLRWLASYWLQASGKVEPERE